MIDLDVAPGPTPPRRRPGARVLVLAVLAALAASPAAPPGPVTRARATTPAQCRADALVRLQIVRDGIPTDTYHVLGTMPAAAPDAC